MTASAASEPPARDRRTRAPRVGFLGPGTFTEQALLTQPDLATASSCRCRRSPTCSRPPSAGDVDLGFVPIENSIEGTVNVTLDTLAFEHRPAHPARGRASPCSSTCWPARASALGDIRRVRVVSRMPSAQCRAFLARELPGRADAGRQLHRRGGPPAGRERRRPRPPPSARRWPPSSTASTCWPTTSRTTPRTRPASCWWPATASRRRPATTRRRSSCSSSADAAGLAARHPPGVRGPRHQPDEARVAARPSGASATTASSSTSRATSPTSWWPTACATSRRKQADVKFLGSYPAAGAHGPARRRAADARWQEADTWLSELRRQVLSLPDGRLTDQSVSTAARRRGLVARDDRRQRWPLRRNGAAGRPGERTPRRPWSPGRRAGADRGRGADEAGGVGRSPVPLGVTRPVAWGLRAGMRILQRKRDGRAPSRGIPVRSAGNGSGAVAGLGLTTTAVHACHVCRAHHRIMRATLADGSRRRPRVYPARPEPG